MLDPVVWAKKSLQHLPSGQHIAEALACHVLAIGPVDLILGRGRWLSAQRDTYAGLVQRGAQGEPLAYLLGEVGFYESSLYVNADVLVPRPETELLVDQALLRLPERGCRWVADLGTGSGAVAVAVAKKRPACCVLAVDQSWPALQVAARNRTRHVLENMSVMQGDWASGLARRGWDMLVSNPPYVSIGDRRLDSSVARYEPSQALYAGPDGLACYRRLIPDAARVLRLGGWLLLEHAPDQVDAVSALMQQYGFAERKTYCDLAQHPRVTLGQLVQAEL